MTEFKCVIGTNSWGNRTYEKVVRGSYVEDAVIEEAVETALNICKIYAPGKISAGAGA